MVRSKPTLVFLSTYPPRECGIATFTQDLLTSIKKVMGDSLNYKVAALNLSEADAYEYSKDVHWQLDQNNEDDYVNLASEINKDEQISAVIIQHEYGIYGGRDGEKLLSFMEKCKKPMTITFHTVLPEPSYTMHNVTSKLISHASCVIVLSETSRHIIETIYQNSIGKVTVIPHGIHPVSFSAPSYFKNKLTYNGKMILSTFGLLSRGKGIEYVIKAMPRIIEKFPNTVYLVLGETHPVVRLNEGEKYRTELLDLVDQLNLKKNVKFYDKYFSVDDLLTFLRATDIYISTSLNPNQAVSGTFSYALGTGRAVVSTDFAQAREYLHKDLGEIVPIKDSDAYSAAVIKLLEKKGRLYSIHRRAYAATRQMLWNNVGLMYLTTLQKLKLEKPFSVLPPIKLDHFKKMTDNFGLFQFANGNIPNPEYGYTIDDNARAAIASCLLLGKENNGIVNRQLLKYVNFIDHCLTKQKNFANYISYDKKEPSTQNDKEDLEDAYSRAMLALVEVITNKNVSKNTKRIAERIWKECSYRATQVTYVRSRAFIIKALCKYVADKENHPYNLVIKKHADFLISRFREESATTWQWFEDELTYSNADIPESLLLAGKILKNNEYLEVGAKALSFLIKRTFINDIYFPIGQNGWYKKRKTRAYFDQQPEDPSSMITALTTAWEVFGDDKYSHLAFKCFSWFLGNNILGLPMYNYADGGCFDGLTPHGVNHNEGAESLLSYLLARMRIEKVMGDECNKC